MQGKLSARLFLISLTALFCPLVAADEDLQALVKELSAQVKQLANRVGDLEQQLAQERELRRQSANNTQSTSASKAPNKPVGPAPAGISSVASIPSISPADPVKSEPKPVTVGDIKGSFKIPGTDTSLALGGYAKLDLVYNSISTGFNNYTDLLLVPGSIPVGTARLGENSQINFTARESRFWLKSFTPTSWGDLSTYLEMDFYAFQSPGDERATNSHAPRMRHAYGSLGNFLAGQTWSTFMNVAALPETNDHGGPVGQIFMRQPLIRWTQPFTWLGNSMEFQGALESPETTLTLPNGTRLTPDDDRYPDMVARLNYNPVWGSLSVAGMARQIRYSPNDTTHQETQAWGGAVSLAGRIKTYELDNIRFMVNYGNALGRYTTYDVFNDGALDSTGQIQLTDVFAGFASYQHWWSQTLRSTVAYGFAQVADPSYLANTTASKQVQSVHVNLLWSPLLQTTIGLEYIYASRQLESGEEGDLQRVQFSTRFNF